MKDLIFRNQSGSVNVTYRTTLIDPAARNFTVLDIYGLEIQNPTNTLREKLLSELFKKLPYDLQSFVTFANVQELELTMRDTNGENAVILSRMFDDASDSGS